MKVQHIIPKLLLVLCGVLMGGYASAYDFQVDDQLFFEVISTSDLTCKLDSVSANYEGSLTIPEKVPFKAKDLTVISVGTNCIHACTHLKSVVLPGTISTLEEGCFSECVSLQSADISKFNSTELSSDIFKDCTSLTNVLFPTTVTYLPENFLYGCTGLTKFEIPSWITNIHEGCFYGCTGLSDLKIPEGVQYIGSNALAHSHMKILSLPSTLQSLGKQACYKMNLDSSLNLPDGLISIRDNCFEAATIPSITISASVESIGNECFKSTHIDTIIFKEDSPITELGYSTFESSTANDIILPSNLEKVGESCFRSCSNLKTIIFPKSLRELGSYSLGALSLESLNLSMPINSISSGCFDAPWSKDTSIKHFTWGIPNYNENRCNEYLASQIGSSTVDPTGTAYDLEENSVYLPEIEEFEISAQCNLLYLGIFSGSNEYTNRLFEYYQPQKLIISESEVPLTIVSVENSGNKRTYKIYNTFPEDASGFQRFNKEWMWTLKDLYIGREINGNPLDVPYLERLTIGNVAKVDIAPEPLPCLEVIECTSDTPPSINAEHFSKEQYLDLLVIVPDDAIETYQIADVWRNFWNLTTKSEYIAGIESTKHYTDTTEVARYDCWGNRVDSAYSGIVIILYSDGSTKKFVQR